MAGVGSLQVIRASAGMADNPAPNASLREKTKLLKLAGNRDSETCGNKRKTEKFIAKAAEK